MTDAREWIIQDLNRGDGMLRMQTGDLSQEDAVRRARGDEGASIAWIVGHLLVFRGFALAACGQPRENPWASRFSTQAPATDGAEYPSLDAMLEEWGVLHDALTRAVADLSDDDLGKPTEVFGGGQTVLDLLRFCTGHESYHSGALGLLRVQWGYKHTHVLAMEARGIQASHD
ncbi:MAG: DinB family protein [Gemmatimonadetes bacterium]|nr:DinB family protein [Gemmatimonadota bacterium]